MTKNRYFFPFILIGYILLFLIGPANSNVYAQEDIQCVWKDVDRIVVVGDLHGDYDNFVKILKKTDLIDDQLNWIGGKTHLVQTGDVLDRGSYARKIFDLIIKLEKESEAAGGKVHMLIGNHEEMNIVGIAFSAPFYVSVGQFRSFLSEDFKAKKEKRLIANYKKNNPDYAESNGGLEAELDKFWKEYMTLKRIKAEKEYFVGFNELYGDWLLKHNIVVKINNIIFAHAGISEKYSTYNLKKINNDYRKEVILHREAFWPNKQAPTPEIIYDTLSPLWYREVALVDEVEMKDIVDRIFNNLFEHHEVEYMVMAHTPKMKRISSRFDGRVWLIDTSISYFYGDGGHPAALIIENGEFFPKEFKNEK